MKDEMTAQDLQDAARNVRMWNFFPGETIGNQQMRAAADLLDRLAAEREMTGEMHFTVEQVGDALLHAMQLIAPPPALLPVGTLVTVDAAFLREGVKVIVDATCKPHYLLDDNSGRSYLAMPDDVQPLIPAYLGKGGSAYPTTGEYKVQDGKLYLEVETAPHPGMTSRHYWPMAECKPLADDSRWRRNE